MTTLLLNRTYKCLWQFYFQATVCVPDCFISLDLSHGKIVTDLFLQCVYINSEPMVQRFCELESWPLLLFILSLAVCVKFLIVCFLYFCCIFSAFRYSHWLYVFKFSSIFSLIFTDWTIGQFINISIKHAYCPEVYARTVHVIFILNTSLQISLHLVWCLPLVMINILL